MQTNNKEPNNQRIKRKPRKPWLSIVGLFAFILSLVIAFIVFTNLSVQKLTHDKLTAKLDQLDVTWEEVTFEVDDNVSVIKGKYTEQGKEVKFEVIIPSWEQDVIWSKFETKVDKEGEAVKLSTSKYSAVSVTTIIINILPFVLMIGLLWFLMSKMSSKGGPGGSVLGSNKPKHQRIQSNVKFSDVAGLVEEKQELAEIVDYLMMPQKFAAMGAKVPKGVLLSGQPGTGKTMLAKAVSGEANVPFFTMSGSSFLEMYVGVGASRVRALFSDAKKVAPCIIFIDEIDAIGRSRGSGMGGGNDEREQTLNALLVEMDGFSPNAGVIVMAATNRPDILDPALLRAGRFDRKIMVSTPDVKEREAILKIHTRNKRIDPSVDLKHIAASTPGFSGADLENIINEAAILAVRANKNIITNTEVDEAVDRVIAGPAKKNKVISDKQKNQIAYHESGHAIVGIELDSSQVQKVTIIPRGQALGYVLHSPEEDKYIVTKEDMINDITVGLAGRAAEEIIFGKERVSSGAQNDIEKATKMARNMVTQYGMSPLGLIQFEKPDGPIYLGRDLASTKNFSGETANKIDAEIKIIIDKAYLNALDILKKRKKDMDNLSTSLLSVETLSRAQIEEVLKTKKPLLLEDRESKVEKVVEKVDVAKTAVVDMSETRAAKKPTTKSTTTKKPATKKPTTKTTKKPTTKE